MLDPTSQTPSGLGLAPELGGQGGHPQVNNSLYLSRAVTGSTGWIKTIALISAFCREVDEVCALLGHDVAHSRISLPMFRDNLDLWSLKMGPIGCPKRRQGITTIFCIIAQKSANLRNRCTLTSTDGTSVYLISVYTIVMGWTRPINVVIMRREVGVRLLASKEMFCSRRSHAASDQATSNAAFREVKKVRWWIWRHTYI